MLSLLSCYKEIIVPKIKYQKMVFYKDLIYHVLK